MNPSWPSFWQTDRCTVRKLRVEEEKAAQLLYERSAPLPIWTGQPLNPAYIGQILSGSPELPPGGQPHRLHAQLASWREEEGVAAAEAEAWRKLGAEISMQEKAEHVAYVELYEGYPQERDLYINLFVVDPSWRGQRLGSELVSGILGLAAQQSYETVRAAVDLKNWAALRFWLSCGFKEAVKASGDQEFGEHAFARLELACRIAEQA